MEWSVLALFLGVQLAVGVWASRRVKSEEDYLVAGRRLGIPLVTMSMFATWFGAETCLGSSGAVYEQGLSGGRADQRTIAGSRPRAASPSQDLERARALRAVEKERA